MGLNPALLRKKQRGVMRHIFEKLQMWRERDIKEGLKDTLHPPRR
jgi:hypothetical protein